MFCLFVVLAKLSLLAKWLGRKTPLRKPNRGEGIISIKPRPKSAHDFLSLLYCFIVLLCICVVSCPYVIYYPTVMARYSLFVLKVPLNPKQTNKPGLALSVVYLIMRYIVLLFIWAPFMYCFCWYVFCLLVVPVKSSLLANQLARKTPLRKANRGEGIISIKPRPKSVWLSGFIVFFLCLIVWYFCIVPRPYVIYFLPLCLFVCLLAGLLENYSADFHNIHWKGGTWAKEKRLDLVVIRMWIQIREFLNGIFIRVGLLDINILVKHINAPLCHPTDSIRAL